MLRFSNVVVNTDPNISGEGKARHKFSDENILLLNEVHVKEVRERFAVEDCDHVRVHVSEERERRRKVGTENAALVLLHSRLEEAVWFLEPEVVQPV